MQQFIQPIKDGAHQALFDEMAARMGETSNSLLILLRDHGAVFLDRLGADKAITLIETQGQPVPPTYQIIVLDDDEAAHIAINLLQRVYKRVFVTPVQALPEQVSEWTPEQVQDYFASVIATLYNILRVNGDIEARLIACPMSEQIVAFNREVEDLRDRIMAWSANLTAAAWQEKEAA